MRLHHLRVSAFGPFADAVDLDLDQVADQGLFLIRGATGAGKTSLLDAVSFALYADVAGARSKKGLHSDHAAPGTVPQVTLELTASGRRMRIERSPEFRRPKARGSGETTVPAKAALFEQVDGSWRALSTRHDEIADVIQDVIGLGLQQFSKVVLLPQGDFAAFLRASPEERRELLERLFDVSAFVGLEDWFAQRRKESAAELDVHQTGLAADLGVLAEVLAGVPGTLVPDSPDWMSLAPGALPAALTDVTGVLEGAAASSLASLDAARLADAAATAAHADAVRLDGLRERGTAALARRDALLLARAEQDEAVAALDAATRAASVHGDLRALDRAESQLVEAGDSAQAAQLAASRLGLDDRTSEDLELVLDRLLAGTQLLDGAAARRAAIGERTRRRDETRRREIELADGVARLTAGVDAAAEHQAEASDRWAQAAAASADLDVSARLVADLHRLHRLRTEQDRATAQADTAAEQLAEARDAAQDLRERYLDLRQARLDGMAAELAAMLSEGDPCPVCGAHEHPDLAHTSEAVTADEVDRAEQVWRTAESAVTARTRDVAAVQAAIDERGVHLGEEHRSAGELAEAGQVARSAHDALARVASTLPALQTEVDRAARRREALTIELAALRETLSAAGAAGDTLQRDLEAEQAGLGAVLAEHDGCPCASTAGDLEVCRREHDTARADLEAMLATRRRLEALAAECEVLRGEVLAAVRAAGFAGLDEARDASLPAGAVAELRQATSAWQQALAGAQGTLEDPDVGAALSAPAPDVAGQAAARDTARSELLRVSSDDALLRRTLDALARVRAAIEARCSRLAAAHHEHLVLRELADTLGGTGSNALRMRLSAFVLAARLEKVVALANERLGAMGDGRYQLRHTDGLAARGARSGLGLEVLDLWTGHPRDTSSLSGGESFMASLALALGLADAVREESGGFDLQTLFIDEGFGTLDDESLEQVMEVLDGLREGGRAVGVVSHVAELRSRIPSQVIVSKSERGSTVRLAGADSAAPAA